MRSTVVTALVCAAALGCSSSQPGSGPPGATHTGGVAGAGASSGAGGSASGGTGGKVSVSNEVCSAFCKAGHSLGCVNDPGGDESCTYFCNVLAASVKPCAEQGEAWLACVAKDADNLECDKNGDPNLGANATEGACRQPFNEYMACACTGEGLGYQPDPETARAGCEKGCSAQASLSCADADCASECEALSPMHYSWPISSALYECLGEQPKLAYECSDEGNATLSGDATQCSGVLFTGLFCGFTSVFACSADACLGTCEDNMCQGKAMSEDCRKCMLTAILNAE